MSSPAFLPRGERPAARTRAHRLDARSGYRVFRGSDGFEVAVAEQLVERGLACCRRVRPLEWIGILVGTLHHDDTGRHVVLRGLVVDPAADATTTSVRTSLGSEGVLRRAAATYFPDAVVVGWCHGHPPGIGAFYSHTDRENQRAWSDPDSIGIVFEADDPRELAVFRGPQSERLEAVTPVEHHDEAAGGPGTTLEPSDGSSNVDDASTRTAPTPGRGPDDAVALAVARLALRISLAALAIAAFVAGGAVVVFARNAAPSDRMRSFERPALHAAARAPREGGVDQADTGTSSALGLCLDSPDGSTEDAGVPDASEEVSRVARNADHHRPRRRSVRRRPPPDAGMADES